MGDLRANYEGECKGSRHVPGYGKSCSQRGLSEIVWLILGEGCLRGGRARCKSLLSFGEVANRQHKEELEMRVEAENGAASRKV